MATSYEQAMAAVARRASGTAGADRSRLAAVLDEEITAARVDELAGQFRSAGRLTLNFHPDRRGRDATTVAEGLLRTGRYRPQNETGLSNGQRFTVAGGMRTHWETELFGDAYAIDEPARPVYGAVDLTHDPHGGAPRFGSCAVVLADHCFDRATICVGDSHVGPKDVGTIAECTAILTGLFELAAYGVALDRGLDIVALQEVLAGWRAQTPARSLDGYLEAQIHGPVSLADDVTEVLIDPSFRDTEVAANLTDAAERYGFELRWHAGSVLAVADVPSDFRGPTMPQLAREVAPDGVLDVAAIGQTLSAFQFVEPTVDGDPEGGPLQQYKKLWHCLLAYGSDAEQRTD